MTALYDTRLAARFYPEIAAGGFTRADGSVAFYSRVAALMRADHQVLDFGAGRGEPIADDPVAYRRDLMNFRGRCAHAAGCDVSAAVLQNPYLDSAERISPGAPLPYADGRFDLIVSRYTFEHINEPAAVADELIRVLKPGGWLCVTTPNAYGYVAIAARLLANHRHAAALQAIQPGRKAEDVFPTVYRLNTPGALRRHFGHACDVHAYRDSAEPAYHFGSPLLFGAFRVLHAILPPVLRTGLFAFLRKR
ncbi:MAG: class I SAM-dependent methyltransferase [Sphingomonadaceae bacterium]|nr:class I SAM-dependent methyltransferase [Sphingomonadaceae bacterium]